ncbi:unnamed protein product [Phytomonas sp. Hart1]|nr:unnamed protein product [Phytomonas sp. Hart1]|eukprot:CCW68341.1 unnamed protein product [Phytomonas sp. isolate Hart1]
MGPPFPKAEPFSCTSWLYGDVSQAKPGQLPQGIAGSAAENNLKNKDDDGNPARRVWQLSGHPQRALREGTAVIREGGYCTNPVPVPYADLLHCQSSRRLENEGYVLGTVAQSGHSDLRPLPEVPGHHDGRTRAALTCTNPACAPGEQATGELTRFTREIGKLRDSHGTLRQASALARSLPGTDLAALARVRTLERKLAVDRVDPHRHKLH